MFLAEPTSRRVPLATGLDYHILEWPPADSECDHTAILVHGYLDISWGWRPVADAGLGGQLHLVAPDMRGHGDSDRVGAGGYYHFFDYLADLDNLITKMGRQRVSLVGHSMGGTIVSYYAGAFPERVHRLVLLEGMGPPVPDVPMQRRVRSWVKGWQRARAEPPRTYSKLADAVARLRAHDPFISEDMALEMARRGTAATTDGQVRFKHDGLHLTRGPYPFVLEHARELWQQIRCPTLLMEARDSQYVRMIPDLRERYACIPNTAHVFIENAGHMMHRHQPAELATIISDFLD